MHSDLRGETLASLGALSAAAWQAGDWRFCAEVICEVARRRWDAAVSRLEPAGPPVGAVGPVPDVSGLATDLERLQVDLGSLPGQLVDGARRQYPDVDEAALYLALAALIPESEQDLLDPSWADAG